MKYLVSVYRDADCRVDCTNGGVSSRFNRLMLYSVNEPLPENPMHDARTPICVLKAGYGRSNAIVRPHPALLRDGESSWTMYGGNFAASSDSSFLDAVEGICGFRVRAVCIHDRVE